jgi:hypothetical protein
LWPSPEYLQEFNAQFSVWSPSDFIQYRALNRCRCKVFLQ